MTPQQRQGFLDANRDKLIALYEQDIQTNLRKLRESEGVRRDEIVGIVGYLQDCLRNLEPKEIPPVKDKKHNDYV